MSGASSLLLVIDFICICVGLAGIIAGGVGHSWWKSEILGGKIEEGLWRRCTDTLVTSSVACSRREDILKFKAAGEDRDIILVLLIGATVFALMALITVASMCCCQRSRGVWICGCVLASITIFIAAFATFGAVVYAEVEIEWKNGMERGWSAIAAWIGGVLCTLSFVLALVLCCIVPKPARYNQTGYAMR